MFVAPRLTFIVRLLSSPPQGVLKAGTIEFVPPLPDVKTDAIARLGMGNLNKLILEFPHRFWRALAPFVLTFTPSLLAKAGWFLHSSAFLAWHSFSHAEPMLVLLLFRRSPQGR